MGYLGFKQLLRRGDGFLYSPMHQSQRWVMGEVYESIHNFTYTNFTEKSDSTKLHCDLCGFHSFKRPEFLFDYTRKRKERTFPSVPIWCVVDNFGTVVEHELGWRSSHSKLIFITENIRELADWCDDELRDYMPEALIEWLQGDDPSEWIAMGDYGAVIHNFIQNWLENGRDANLGKPDYDELRDGNFPRGWGRLSK